MTNFALVFPGQGSQHPGMALPFDRALPGFAAALAEFRVGAGPYTVPISVMGASQLSSVSITLTFNPAVLRVRSVQEGSFMRTGGINAAFTQQVDSAAGRVDIAITRTGDRATNCCSRASSCRRSGWSRSGTALALNARAARLEAITGVPHAIASTSGTQKPSCSLSDTYTLDER